MAFLQSKAKTLGFSALLVCLCAAIRVNCAAQDSRTSKSYPATPLTVSVSSSAETGKGRSGRAIYHENVDLVFSEEMDDSDLTDQVVNWVPSKDKGAKDGVALVEMTIVTDVEFGSLFQYDAAVIRNYLNIFMWDASLRLRTLSSVNVTIKISEVIVLREKNQQPFIEKARNETGHIESFQLVRQYFDEWTYEHLQTTEAKFDVAVLVTNSVDRPLGKSHIGGACAWDHDSKRYLGTAIFTDRGTFRVRVAAHEIGHTLGAFHDHQGNLSEPCYERGYIMSYDMDAKRQHYYSTCSNRMIGNFLKSDASECLRRVDNPKASFAKTPAPSRQTQCQDHLRREDVFVNETESDQCVETNCFWEENGDLHYEPIWLVDATPCGTGRECFRGKCIAAGRALQNVASGGCVTQRDHFESNDRLSLVECPDRKIASPLEQFSVRELAEGHAIWTPYSTRSGAHTGEKCLIPDDYEGGLVNLLLCTSQEYSFWAWEEIPLNENQFLLRHRDTGRCAKTVGRSLLAYSECDQENTEMVWEWLK